MTTGTSELNSLERGILCPDRAFSWHVDGLPSVVSEGDRRTDSCSSPRRCGPRKRVGGEFSFRYPRAGFLDPSPRCSDLLLSLAEAWLDPSSGEAARSQALDAFLVPGPDGSPILLGDTSRGRLRDMKLRQNLLAGSPISSNLDGFSVDSPGTSCREPTSDVITVGSWSS